MPKQRFIPGLNSRPDDVEMPPRQPEKTDIDILTEEFMKGKKNAAMCLNEYCQKQKLELNFREGPVEFKPGQPRTFGNFGCFALVEGAQYPQGVGSTKKEAKVAASKLCLRAILGFDDYTPEEVKPEIDDSRYIEVRDLLDICHAQSIQYEKMMTQDVKGVHTCTIYLSKRDPIKHTHVDREEAVVTAHRKAISALRGHTDSDASALAAAAEPSNGFVHQPVPDAAAAKQREYDAYQALSRTLQTLPPDIAQFDHQIGAVFMSNQHLPDYKGVGKIVAFGTGNSSLGVEHLTEDGRCVFDSCATTTTRRAFKRYVGHEMLACYNGSKESIFELSLANPHRLRLRAGFELHFFLSHPPEGDYKEALTIPSSFTPEELSDIAKGAHNPNFTEDTHGLTRCRNEHNMIELADQTPSLITPQQVRLSNEVWVMTASDKLLRWNILGLQGAAFMHFLETPLYLKSISLGYHHQNDHGHMSRAVCCRVYPELEASFPQPSPFVINHPVLSFSPDPEVRAMTQLGQQVSPHSMNWSLHDNKAELSDGLTGRSNQASPFQVSHTPLSRQCQAGMHLKWFRDLSKQAAPALLEKSPAQIKALAGQYQQVKAAFLQHCTQNGIGQWIHMPQGQWASIGK